MTTYQEITKKDWKESALIIGAFVAVAIIASVFLLPTYWYLYVIIIVSGIFALIYVAAKGEKSTSYLYECPKCKQEFEVSTLTSLLAPHGVTKKDGNWYEWKYLECPMCHQKARLKPIKKEEPAQPSEW